MLLVTGATGYLGAVLVTLLRDEGLQPRAVVRAEARAAALPEGVPWAVADLSDREALTRAADGCTGVFHLAASVGHDAAETRALNVTGTGNVLAAARAAGVPRFVLTSTSAASVDPTGLVDERATGGTALVDPYSTSKAEAERLTLAAADLETVVVNPVNIYGPSPAGPHSYNGLFAAAAAGEVAEVVDAPVGWVLAEDVALGHLLAFRRGEPGRRYVLCGEVAPFGRLLHGYAQLVGSPHRVRLLAPGAELGPDASTFARRSEVYGKLGPVRVDDAGARALGFAPRGVDEGLRRTAEWLPTALAGR